MQIPGWLQLTAIGIAGLVVVIWITCFADRPPYTAPVDEEYEP